MTMSVYPTGCHPLSGGIDDVCTTSLQLLRKNYNSPIANANVTVHGICSRNHFSAPYD